MKTNITGKNYTPSDNLKKTVAKKFEKLDKYFSDDITGNIMVIREKGGYKMEATINAKGTIFRAEVKEDDPYDGVDRIIDKLSNQMSKYKTKLQKKHKGHKEVMFADLPVYDELPEEEESKVVKKKKFELTPMTVDEAILQMELVEPVKLLFKDEVRVVGEALGLPHNMVYRQPFPGPGLGVRCLGAITRDRLEALREADAILREEFDKNGLAEKVWQYFIAVPDIKSVGVKDESRYEGWPAIIRAVNTKDAMSATIEEIPYEILHHITYRITHEVPGINRVLMDLTPKPIGTIEWE